MNRLGERGEEVACDLLKRCGYTILERNYRIGHFEVDIIAQKGGFLHIIEVKSLFSYNNFQGVNPIEKVNKEKQKRIINIASGYLKRNRLKLEVCFDIISIIFDYQSCRTEFIKEAFTPLW